MKTALVVILALLLFALALTFGVQNTQQVTVNYLIAKGDVTVAALVGIAMFIGFLIGLLVTAGIYLRLRWRQLRLSRQLHRQQRALDKHHQQVGADAE